MANEIVLKATRRSVVGKQVKALRRQGELPAVMYGHSIKEPVNISLDAHQASLVIPGLSSSAIVTIELDGKKHAALVREKQKDYVKNRLLHIDFQVVSLNEKIRAAVRLDLHGVSPAVKEHNAVIVTNLTQLDVEALPRDLPDHLVVDISKIATVGDSIRVSDLDIPGKVTVLTDPEEIVVVATGAAPEVEEVEEAVAEGEPEVIERGKKEDEEE